MLTGMPVISKMVINSMPSHPYLLDYDKLYVKKGRYLI